MGRAQRASAVRFGIFDFDPGTGELRREGIPVRLQSQPAQVLTALVACPGAIVTRESLREAVWGTDTFVDFDRGLNFCIAQIRSALGDSAESPRYIKTIPKRGYQFIAPVLETAASPAPPAPRSRRWLLLTGIPVAAGILVWRQPWDRPALPVIAVARFDNETGSPELDRFAQGLTDTLVGELTAAGANRYSIIGNAAALLQPRRFRDVKMIGDTLGVKYVVLGQVQRNASTVRVLAHLIRLPEQTHLAVTRLDCDPTDPLRAQSELAGQIAATFHARLTSSPVSPTH